MNLDSKLTVLGIRKFISSKVNVSFEQIKIFSSEGQVPDNQKITFKLLSDGLVFHIIPFLTQKPKKNSTNPFVMRTNKLVDSCIHPENKARNIIQVYHDAHRRLTDPLYPLPSNYSQNLESICNIHPNHQESEKMFKIFNFNFDRTINYFLKPSSYYESNSDYSEISSSKSSKNQRKGKNNENRNISIYQEFFNRFNNRNPKRSKSKHINYISPTSEIIYPSYRLSSSAPPHRSNPPKAKSHDPFSQLAKQISKPEEDIVRKIMNQTNTDFIEVLQFFLMTEKDPNATVQMIMNMKAY